MSLNDRISQANQSLAPYAVPHIAKGNRVHADTDDATRFAFQRDRDRIIHSDAFRRLKHKTQVFVTPTSDHFRTRLTHTLEVAQISRDIARTIKLNEDLAEAIALAHDLGHTPFGHAGEEAMNACMQKYQKHFEHNEQSYRICTVLEERKVGQFGLNLCKEVLDGLLKHSTPHDTPKGDIPVLDHSPSLEAQVCNIADEIAYSAHDTEDGIRAEMFALSEVVSFLPQSVVDHIDTGTTVRSAIIEWIVSDLYQTTEAMVTSMNIKTLDDVYSTDQPIIKLSDDTRSILEDLREFLWNRMYMHKVVIKQANHGRTIITELFAAYMKKPTSEIIDLQKRTGSALEESVKDYIAGMTDTFATEQYKKI